MKSEEKDYLFSEKLRNGKERNQAYDEIRELELSQKNFKTLNRELKKKDTIIKNLEKKIEKIQKDNFKNIKLIPDSRNEVKSQEIKESNNGEANLKQINRVMCLIECEDSIGLTDLGKTTLIKPKNLKGILNFLIRYNLIEEVKGSRGLKFRRK